MGEKIKKLVTGNMVSELMQNGSLECFVCDTSHPFNFSEIGRYGAAFIVDNVGDSVGFSTLNCNGILGGSLKSEYPHGFSMYTEIENMAVTKGTVYIYLKPR